MNFKDLYSNLIKGYWMRNNQNGGQKWIGNLYNINKRVWCKEGNPLLVVN